VKQLPASLHTRGELYPRCSRFWIVEKRSAKMLTELIMLVPVRSTKAGERAPLR
jgi:hypothetical protein